MRVNKDSGRSPAGAGSGHSAEPEPISVVSAADAASAPNAECSHLPDYAGEVCGGCGEEIDNYGNTANDFRFCSFSDCGCDGARLCMAGSASERSAEYNVENMYNLRDPRPRMRFMGALYSGEFGETPASGIEAASADETRSGSTVGESPAGEAGDAR